MAVYSVDKAGGRWHIFKDGVKEPGEGFASRQLGEGALKARLEDEFKNKGKKKNTAEAVADTT